MKNPIQTEPKLLRANHDLNYVPHWKMLKFWEYNINPITGFRTPHVNRSSSFDATAKRVKETHNAFTSMHI